MTDQATTTDTQEQTTTAFEAIDMSQQPQVLPAAPAPKPALTVGNRVAAIVPTDIEQTFNATGLEKDVTGFLEIALERGWISV